MKQRFRRIAYPLYTFTTADDFDNFILNQNNQTSIFLIVSGTLGRDILRRIKDFSSIIQIYIFCGNIAAHMHWAFDYIEKIIMLDIDGDLIIRLTHDISGYLANVARENELQGNYERAIGLLDWANWLYNDAITSWSIFSQRHRVQIRQQRENINITHRIQYPN